MSLRPELGDFSSIVCFKYMIVGTEEALGEKAAAIALIAAGRRRGQALAESLGLKGYPEAFNNLTDLVAQINKVIGKEGTRLCIVDKIVRAGDRFRVYTRETICSAGEPPGSKRECTFTLGAIQGFLETVSGQRLRGKHTESVLRGSTHDVLEFSPLA